MKYIFYTIFSIVLSSCVATAQGWNELASLPDEAETRHHPIAFSIGDFGYVLAGVGESGDLLDDMYQYNYKNDSWTKMEDFPGGARGFAYGVAFEEKAYVGFGETYNETDETYPRMNDLWEYDSNTNTWTELSSCPCLGRLHPAMIFSDGFIYMGLGSAEDVGDLKDWWRYEIATDTWSELPEFPSTERHHPYYFAIDGLIYVGFGHHQDSIFNDFYRYDPQTETWQQMADLPAQGRVAGTQFNYNGKGYILSGQGEDHSNLENGEFWEYDTETDSWTELFSHPGGGRWAPGSFLIENRLYLFGGEGDSFKKDLWVYEFEVEEPEPPVAVENLSSLKLNVYPTLFTTTQKQLLIIDTNENLTFRLFSEDGSEVLINNISESNERVEVNFQVPSGVYFLSYQNEKGNKGVTKLQVLN